jgi:ABC-type antimicrobial peptide transport system permease subunit
VRCFWRRWGSRIAPFDLPSFSLAALVLFGAGIVASLLPALRATQVDPIVALREQ